MCWFWHKWGTWQTIKEGEIRKGYGTKGLVGFFMTQKRWCGKCGRIELRTVETW